MDQPTAEAALKELDVLIGEWTMEAAPPDSEPWPGEARERRSPDHAPAAQLRF